MNKRLISLLALIAYCAVLVKVMVFKSLPTIKVGQLMLNFGGTDSGHGPNLVPFTTIVPYLFGFKGLIIAGINLVGNIVLLVPIGFLAPMVYRDMTWKKSFILAVASGLTIEILQTVLRVGIFDIDDVILNAFGVMIGYWAYIFLTKWLRERKYAYIVVAASLVIAAAAGAVYVIYPWGHPVVPEMGAGGRSEEGAVPQGGDLCGGTGGTGEIVSKSDNTITIKRKDSVVQTLTITPQSDIRNSAGPTTLSDLKIGDHVTVVVLDENRTASTVLVCSAT